ARRHNWAVAKWARTTVERAPHTAAPKPATWPLPSSGHASQSLMLFAVSLSVRPLMQVASCCVDALLTLGQFAQCFEQIRFPSLIALDEAVVKFRSIVDPRL